MTKASDLIIFHLLVNGEAVGGANHDSSLMAGDRRKGFFWIFQPAPHNIQHLIAAIGGNPAGYVLERT